MERIGHDVQDLKVHAAVQSEILERMRLRDREERRSREIQLLRLRASVLTAGEHTP